MNNSSAFSTSGKSISESNALRCFSFIFCPWKSSFHVPVFKYIRSIVLWKLVAKMHFIFHEKVTLHFCRLDYKSAFWSFHSDDTVVRWKTLSFMSYSFQIVFFLRTIQRESSKMLNFFIPFFQVIFSQKNRLLQSTNHWRMKGRGGRYQQNPFWCPRRPLRRFLAMSDIYFFIFFPEY